MATGLTRLRSAFASLLIVGSLAVAPRPGIAADDQPPPQPPGRQKILDELFDRLGRAQDDAEAKGIAGAIDRVWMRSGSDTADLLMSRALQAFGQKNWSLSQELLDKVIILDPYWAEAWNKRATARFMAEDFLGSMADLAKVVTLEPRHFAALTGMGFLLRRTGFDKRALQVFRKALEINPQQEEVRKLVDKLTLDVEGQPI